MTDKQIIKALKQCKDRGCTECLRLHNNISSEDDCRLDLINDARGLIERLQFELPEEKAKGSMCAEIIARQDKEIESLESRIFALNDTNKILMESQEVYARNLIKEFAERLQDKLATEVEVTYETNDGFLRDAYDITETHIAINELVEKMTEGNKGRSRKGVEKGRTNK